MFPIYKPRRFKFVAARKRSVGGILLSGNASKISRTVEVTDSGGDRRDDYFRRNNMFVIVLSVTGLFVGAFSGTDGLTIQNSYRGYSKRSLAVATRHSFAQL
jgi:hypothetical protein